MLINTLVTLRSLAVLDSSTVMKIYINNTETIYIYKQNKRLVASSRVFRVHAGYITITQLRYKQSSSTLTLLRVCAVEREKVYVCMFSEPSIFTRVIMSLL